MFRYVVLCCVILCDVKIYLKYNNAWLSWVVKVKVKVKVTMLPLLSIRRTKTV